MHEHEVGNLAFEFGGKGTALFGHLTPRSGEHSRLNGCPVSLDHYIATCLRLEEVYWDVLSDIAVLNDCSINALLSYVDREVHLRHGGVKNFSGLIRVVCVMHLLNTSRDARRAAPETVCFG